MGALNEAETAPATAQPNRSRPVTPLALLLGTPAAYKLLLLPVFVLGCLGLHMLARELGLRGREVPVPDRVGRQPGRGRGVRRGDARRGGEAGGGPAAEARGSVQAGGCRGTGVVGHLDVVGA